MEHLILGDVSSAVSRDLFNSRALCTCNKKYTLLHQYIIEPVRERMKIWVPTRSDTNRAVPSQMAGSLKFWI